MTFGAPWMLWGLLLALIPLILHFLSRRQYQTEDWAAMQFLLQAQEKMRERLRWNQLLSLLIRTLLLIFLALAFADPDWRHSPNAVPHSSDGVHRVIVLDTTYSMQRRTSSGQSLFEKMKSAVSELLLSDLSSGSCDLFQITKAAPRRLTSEKTGDTLEQVGQLVHPLEPTAGASDLVATLQEVLTTIQNRTEANQKEIYLFSDFQKVDWDQQKNELIPLLKRLRTHADVKLVDVTRGSELSPNNLAITQFQPSLLPVTVNEQTSFVVQIEKGGQVSASEEEVSLLIEGRAVQTQKVSGDSEGTESLEFTYQFDEPGEYQAEVVIDTEDSLEIDNRRIMTVRTKETPQVLIVADHLNDAAQTRYLETALSSATESGFRPFHLEKRTTNQLSTVDLSRFDIVICSNIKLFLPEEALKLSEFVREGGSLLFWLGDRVDARAWQQELGFNGTGLFPLRLLKKSGNSEGNEEGTRVSGEKLSHPLFAPFQSESENQLAQSLILEYWKTEPEQQLASQSDLKPILLFENSDPLIWESRYEHGLVFLVTSSADNLWGPWPLQPIFPALVHRMVEYGITESARSPKWLVGQELVWEVPSDVEPESVSVRSPSGKKLVPEKQNDETSLVYRVQATEPGVYELENSESQTSRLKTVNLETSESKLTSLHPENDLFGKRYSLEEFKLESQRRPFSLAFPLLLLVVMLLGADRYVRRRNA